MIKISGNLSDDENQLRKICSFVKHQIVAGNPIVIVHGGGRQSNELSRRLGVAIKQIAGRRITDKNTLEVMLYAVGGSVNKKLVSTFRKYGIKAVGLSGIDGNLTTSKKRPPMKIEGLEVDFGLVGEFENIDPELVITLIEKQFIPVIACLTWSETEGILNINADTFSLKLAIKMKCNKLYMLMGPEAVLDAEQRPIAELTRTNWKSGLAEGWIVDGMQPKLQTGFEALDCGVSNVILTNPDGLIANTGTILINE